MCLRCPPGLSHSFQENNFYQTTVQVTNGLDRIGKDFEALNIGYGAYWTPGTFNAGYNFKL